jgi:NADH:ubiquinone oxidoreductase subunit 5 (subunit L)/multisubunit Na+/H+ antiporter MnhA subunit
MGLVVCLLHTLNHAVFKSVLFLTAGAVIHATHATSLEAYGGLIKRMPQTAVMGLIGALALAALPPLNGFPSEWLTFQLLVAGARHTAPALAIVLPLALAGVALVAGLAAVSAVRLFGITFLALPRTSSAEDAVEAPPTMRFAIAIPAIACLLLGFLPALTLPVLARLAGDLGLPVSDLTAGLALSLPLVGSRLWPIGLNLLLLGVGATLAVTIRRRSQAARAGDAWNCGRVLQTARTEYTAAAFAEPLRRVFTGFYQPTQEVTVDVHPVSRYFVRAIRFRGELAPWMEQVLYQPFIRLTERASIATRRLQAGSIHLYLAMLPLALLVLLFIARWVR